MRPSFLCLPVPDGTIYIPGAHGRESTKRLNANEGGQNAGGTGSAVLVDLNPLSFCQVPRNHDQHAEHCGRAGHEQRRDRPVGAVRRQGREARRGEEDAEVVEGVKRTGRQGDVLLALRQLRRDLEERRHRKAAREDGRGHHVEEIGCRVQPEEAEVDQERPDGADEGHREGLASLAYDPAQNNGCRDAYEAVEACVEVRRHLVEAVGDGEDRRVVGHDAHQAEREEEHGDADGHERPVVDGGVGDGNLLGRVWPLACRGTVIDERHGADQADERQDDDEPPTPRNAARGHQYGQAHVHDDEVGDGICDGEQARRQAHARHAAKPEGQQAQATGYDQGARDALDDAGDENDDVGRDGEAEDAEKVAGQQARQEGNQHALGTDPRHDPRTRKCEEDAGDGKDAREPRRAREVDVELGDDVVVDGDDLELGDVDRDAGKHQDGEPQPFAPAALC